MTLPIYIITLKRTPERRLYMQRQLDALNLNYEFVYGVDKFELRSKKYRQEIAQQIGISESQIEYRYWYKNEQGGLAVLLSHIKIYNLMIQRKIPRACILEDDIVMLSNFPKILTNIQKFSWDIVLFSHQSDFFRMLVRIISFRMQSIEKFTKGLERQRNHRKQYPHLRRLSAYQIMMIARLYFHLLKQYLVRFDYKIINLYRPLSLDEYYRNINIEYYSCKLGAIPVPDKSSWHKVMFHYYLAKPYELTSSAMAYGLNLDTAIKYKEEAVFGDSQHIDDCQWQLFVKDKIKLFILIPPCVEAENKYLYYSPRRYIPEVYLKDF